MPEIKRALIMAAGRGQRMRPLTDTCPKPLIPVHGLPMISHVTRALRQNGITEIHAVTGYMEEAFRPWAEQEQVHLVHNPLWDTCNNISSLYAAREFLDSVIILDGDQLIPDPSVLSRQYAKSGYNAVWTDQETGEWLMQVKDGRVISTSRTGGSHGWQLYSVSRWSHEDGALLRQKLEEAFAKEENRNLYWDDVALFLYPDAFNLGIFPMQPGSVLELDSLQELAAEDPETYGGIS